MRVTMFDPGNFTPYYVADLSEALARLGIDVSVVTSPPLFEDVEYRGGIAVEHYFFKVTAGAWRIFFRRHATLRKAMKFLSYPFGLWRTWRALKHQTPGILHFQWSLFPFLDAMLIRQLHSQGWRVVYTAHEVVSEMEGSFRRWAFGRIYREADTVVVHTPGLARKLRDAGFDGQGEVNVIPEGISMFPCAGGIDQKHARHVLGLNPSGPLLLFFGMIKRHKGLEYLLRAWRLVVQEFPGARLLIAGEAMISVRSLERLSRRLGVQDSVAIRAGYIPRSGAQLFLEASDAVVLPHVRTSTSGVIPLAHRYARPVIATSAGALSELVRDGATGFVVAPCSEQDLAEAICRGFRDPERLAAMGARAREWFEKERRWDQIAQRTAAVYRALAQETPKARTARAV